MSGPSMSGATLSTDQLAEPLIETWHLPAITNLQMEFDMTTRRAWCGVWHLQRFGLMAVLYWITAGAMVQQSHANPHAAPSKSDITETDPAAAAAMEAKLISATRQLTFEGRRAGEGYFSADGNKLVFQSERVKDNPFYQIYLLDFETGRCRTSLARPRENDVCVDSPIRRTSHVRFYP